MYALLSSIVADTSYKHTLSSIIYQDTRKYNAFGTYFNVKDSKSEVKQGSQEGRSDRDSQQEKRDCDYYTQRGYLVKY